MLRLIGILAGVLSTTILLAELVGLGYAWASGYLTATKLAAVREVLNDDAPTEETDENEESESTAASRQEVQAARVLRVLDLESRGKELELLKTMTSNTANQLISERKMFDDIKAAFRAELTELSQRHQQEAIEQARAVLLASPADAAVNRLMALPLDESVDLIRGMPEKSIAKILAAFAEPSTTPESANERRERGQKIFEALSRGEPVRQAIEKTISRVPAGAAEPSPDGG